MHNRFFRIRSKCPSCESGAIKELYRLPYESVALKKYLTGFYMPQGTVEFDYLVDAEYILCECGKCQTIYQQQIPNDEFMSRLYGHWINPDLAFAKTASMPRDYYLRYSLEIAQISTLFPAPLSNLRFLDFGMGWGAWAQMAKAFGIQSYGSELTKEQIEHSQSNGINIVEWAEISKHQFDFINTEQVFEHLPEPLETLRHLQSGLKPGGVIKISVPYARDLSRRLKLMDWSAAKESRNSLNPVAPLEHINYFTRKSLKHMGDLLGMENVTIPLAKQYAHTLLFQGDIKSSLINALRPIHRSTTGNYVLLRKMG